MHFESDAGALTNYCIVVVIMKLYLYASDYKYNYVKTHNRTIGRLISYFSFKNNILYPTQRGMPIFARANRSRSMYSDRHRRTPPGGSRGHIDPSPGG